MYNKMRSPFIMLILRMCQKKAIYLLFPVALLSIFVSFNRVSAVPNETMSESSRSTSGCLSYCLVSRTPVTTDIPIEDDSQHIVQVNLYYDKPIDGYTVTVVCYVDTVWNYVRPNAMNNRNAIFGSAILNFRNDTVEFKIENPQFSDYTLLYNEIPLADGVTIKARYTPFVPCTTDNMILRSNESPFFFYDIDFDGERELVVTVWEGMEYHFLNSYKVFKVPNTVSDKILQPITTPPFDRIDVYSRIDSVTKTISICKGVDAMKYIGFDEYPIKN